MASPENRWSSLCPEACPPSEAADANCTVFRTVKADPPSEADFLSYLEEGKGDIKPHKQCQACGISVFRTLKDAQHQRDAIPGVYKRPIAVGQILPTHGKAMDTSSRKFPSHVTWWCYEGTLRAVLFQVYSEEDDVEN